MRRSNDDDQPRLFITIAVLNPILYFVELDRYAYWVHSGGQLTFITVNGKPRILHKGCLFGTWVVEHIRDTGLLPTNPMSLGIQGAFDRLSVALWRRC